MSLLGNMSHDTAHVTVTRVAMAEIIITPDGMGLSTLTVTARDSLYMSSRHVSK